MEKHLNIFPSEFNTYIEPFFGSGAVFFKLAPRKAIISDSNIELMSTYETLRDDWKSVQSILKRHHKLHSKDYYYKIRNMKPRTGASRAARFIYLNRTCWNGLYRVNKSGQFNVPIGTKTNVLMDSDNFENISNALKSAEIKKVDFEETISLSKAGDLVFVDPPYTIKHNQNGFIKYNENLFSWDDQIRLKNAVVDAIERNVKVVLTNAYHESVLALYDGIGRKTKLLRPSVISGNANGRGVYEELLVTCV